MSVCLRVCVCLCVWYSVKQHPMVSLHFTHLLTVQIIIEDKIREVKSVINILIAAQSFS